MFFPLSGKKTQKAAQSRHSRERVIVNTLSLCVSRSLLLPKSAKKDDHTKGETEVKNTTAEVKTVPNEAPQMNGNESKA